MREIKFRAWDKYNKKMYEVFYLGLKDSNLVVFERTEEGYGRTHRKPYPSACELMQLADEINGTEIYEGDIVKLTIYKYDIEKFRKIKSIDEVITGVVKMRYGRWIIFNQEKENEAHYLHPIHVPFTIEVIGNIYEGVK